MIALIQRVSHAQVVIDSQTVGAIGKGLLVLLAVTRHDQPANADHMAKRLLSYRVFNDDKGLMNLSLQQVNGELLLVPQFTLAADTSKGLRPSFSNAAPPDMARQLFDYLQKQLQPILKERLQCGVFGADMQVELTNMGPVTFWLDT